MKRAKSIQESVVAGIWVFLLILVCCRQTGYAQEASEPLRPKVGLVLSGGGARGFAHIGVLQILDSLQIPIDYIAGTSIGAIIGGLYSVGYSSADMDSLAAGIQWSDFFSDSPPRKNLSFLEKQETGRFQLAFKINGYQLNAPSGLINGQKVQLWLSRLMLPRADEQDFSRLPIPFRCVAVDLVTGNEVVLEKGSLTRAIRASMAVPSIFTPVEWGDSLLVDGGLLNNLPVDVVRNMGADYVIAVNVGTPKRSRKDLENVVSILLQSINLSGYIREGQNLKNSDLVITPDLQTISNTDFAARKVEQMITLGAREARKSLPELMALKQNLGRKPAARHPGEMPEGLIHGIRIIGNEKLTFSFIYRNLGIRPGEKLNIRRLEKRISQLYSLGYFQLLNYQIKERPDHTYLLEIHVREKPLRLFRMGLRYQDDKKLIAGVNMRLNDFPLAGMRNDLTLLFSGVQLLDWEVSLPRRMLGSRLFPFLEGYYQDIPLNIYSGGNKIAQYRNRVFGGALGLGLIVRNWGILRGSYNLDRLLINPSIALTEGMEWPEWNYNVHYGRITAEFDFLNNPLVPTHGYKGVWVFDKTFPFIDQRDDYSRFYVRQSFYGQMIPHSTTSIHLFLGMGRNLPVYRYFYQGGPDSFVGKNYEEFASPNMGIYRLEHQFHVTDMVSFLMIYNAGNLWETVNEIRMQNGFYQGFGGGILMNTVVGPFRYILGHSGGESYHYFTLGFSLSANHFNRY